MGEWVSKRDGEKGRLGEEKKSPCNRIQTCSNMFKRNHLHFFSPVNPRESVEFFIGCKSQLPNVPTDRSTSPTL